MKIIIPMAGNGSRLRPHTLTIPKPFIPIAGKPIVERLLNEIIDLLKEIQIQEICFIIRTGDQEGQKSLVEIGKKLKIKICFFFQEQPLGTAHALFCAKKAFSGPIIIAFADTLFKTKFNLNFNSQGAIWIKKVKDPSAFGVAKLDENKYIKELKEKPTSFFSDLALIGIYYFKEGQNLKNELELLDFKPDKKQEYQLTVVLEKLINKGIKLSSVEVDEWMDCGNKTATLSANHRILEFEYGTKNFIHPKAKIIDSLIVSPCFIGENASIENSKVGPFVSVGQHTKIQNSNISHSLIQDHTLIAQSNLSNSMIGNHATCIDLSKEISLGDYSSFAF